MPFSFPFQLELEQIFKRKFIAIKLQPRLVNAYRLAAAAEKEAPVATMAAADPAQAPVPMAPPAMAAAKLY